MIRDSQFVTILNITLTDCAVPHYYYNSVVGFALYIVCNTRLRHISIRNTSSTGLFVLNCFNLTIEDSSFFYNQYLLDSMGGYGENVLIVYTQHSNTSNKFSIVRSNFSFSLG